MSSYTFQLVQHRVRELDTPDVRSRTATAQTPIANTILDHRRNSG